MKKIFTCFYAIFISFSLYAQNPVPNPGFELWTGTEPDSWGTINSAPIFPVTQVTPGHSGTYAIKGEVVAVGPGSNIAPFIASTSGGIGFPVTQNYTELSFWYSSLLQNGDELEADVLITDTAGNTVAFAIQTFPASMASFTKANVPITSTGGVPATCAIIFTISNASTQTNAGSSFIIDDVVLSNTSGIDQPESGNDVISLFPNPASDWLHLEMNTINGQNKMHELNIFDLSGRIILYNNIGINGSNQETAIDISGIPAGAYILQVTDGKTLSRKMFMKQ